MEIYGNHTKKAFFHSDQLILETLNALMVIMLKILSFTLNETVFFRSSQIVNR